MSTRRPDPGPGRELARFLPDVTRARHRGKAGTESHARHLLGVTAFRTESGRAMTQDEISMWADGARYRYARRAQTEGDPHWDNGQPLDLITDTADGAGGKGVDARRFVRMGPQWLRDKYPHLAR